MTNHTIPAYSELPVIDATGEHHAWDTFGKHDESGTMNFIGPDDVRAALGPASAGCVVNPSLPLNLPMGFGSPSNAYAIL